MRRCKACQVENTDESRICKQCGSTMQRDDARKRLSSMRLHLGVLASHVTPFTSISELSSSPPATKTPSGSLLIAVTLILINILLAFVIQPRVAVIAEASPKLIVTTTTLDFITKVAGDQPAQTLNISNGGGQLLKWQVDTGGTDWITLTVVQGKLGHGDEQVVKVIINTNKLVPKDTPYTATLSFTSNGGKKVVKVIIKVASPPQTPLLCIDPAHLVVSPV